MSAPLRWLLMAGHVEPSLRGGGIVRYTVELARALHRRDDVELHLLSSPQAASALAGLVGGPQRVVVTPAVPGPLVSLVERSGLGLGLSPGRFDVVVGTKHLLPAGVPEGTRTALTVHDMILLDRPEDFGAAKRLLLPRPYRASLRQADVHLCVSDATRRSLTAHEPRLRGRSDVVPLATSPDLLGHAAEPVAEVAGRPFALAVGDANPRKNLPVVVSAWAEVVRSRPDAVLVVVGPPAWGRVAYGPHHDELVESGNLVHLTGIGDGSLRWLYESAAVVLVPSLLEGFGLPAAEALVLGAPLVTSTDAALVEVSGDAAEHLDPQDVTGWARAALRHLDSPAERRPEPHPRTWDDVAADTVTAVLG